MSNERRDEIEYASRVERAHRPLRQAREQFANELGDRRSLKIIRVVRPLTRSLRNCGIVVRNISTNVPTKFFLVDPRTNRKPRCTFQTTKHRNGSDERKERSIVSFFGHPSPRKTNFPPSKNSKVLRYLLPLATNASDSSRGMKIFRNRPDSVHAMSILTIGNSVIKCFILRIIFPLYSPFFCRSKKILRFIIIIIIFSP